MCEVIHEGLGPIDGGPPNPDVYSTACSCNALVSAHASTATSTFRYSLDTVTETLTTFTDASYIPPDNCCIKCWITANDVQIIYWPVETSAPTRENATLASSRWKANSTSESGTITAAPSPYTLVQDEFTFTSPSVYVAYHGLQAYQVCPSFGNTYPKGKTYNTTIAYMPDQLSTSICTTGSMGIQPIGYGHFAAINFTEYQYSTSAWSQCAKEIEAGSGGSASIDGPFYSIPHDVSLIDPDWSYCSAVFNGVFDPPRLLSSAPALVTGQDPGSPGATPIASPGAGPLTPAPVMISPTPFMVSPTPTLPRVDPNKSGTPAINPPIINTPASLPPPNDPPANDDPKNSSPPQAEQSGTVPGQPAPQPAGPIQPAPPSNPIIMHPPDPPAPITVNGVTVARVPTPTTDSSGNNPGGAGSPNGVVIAGSTYTNGASTTIPGGAPLSVAPDHVIVGASSYALPPAPSPSPVLIGGNPINRAPNGGLVIGTATIDPGSAPTTVNGHAISIDHSSAIIDGSTYAIPPASPTQDASNSPNSAITLGNGQVLTAGGAPALISGTTVALASNGASLVINGHDFSIPPAHPSGSLPAQSALTIGGQTFTPSPSGFTVDGQSVQPGANAITVDGARLSLGASGQLVFGSSTTSLPAITAGPATPMVTVGGQTFLAKSAGFAIGSQTLTPGGAAVTVDGTVVSLGPSGKLVVGGQTTTLPSGGGGVEETVGGVVVDAPIATGSSGSQEFTGDGVRLRFGLPHCLAIAVAGMVMM